MAFLRQWLLILFALVLGGGQIIAAGGRENRDYAAAAAAFQDGMYSRAETAFAQFVEKYPKSERGGEAMLLQAQAEIKQGDFTDAIRLLSRPDNQAKAGPLADQYVYWTGEAQFQGANYPAAAETWTALAQLFPESRLRLQALVGAAAAYAELAEWQQTISLLEIDERRYSSAWRRPTRTANWWRAGIYFWRRQNLQLKDFTGASAILEPLLDQTALPPELRWRCGRLLYQAGARGGRNGRGAGRHDEPPANRPTRNKRRLALRGRGVARAGAGTTGPHERGPGRVSGEPDERAGGAAARGDLENRGTGHRRKTTFTKAETNLESFIAQFTSSPARDAALLTLGELYLKNHSAQRRRQIKLAEAQAWFDQFIGTFTNSPLLGKAYLDRGWCDWLAAKLDESSGDVQAAAQKYSASFEDFKTAAQKIAALQQPPTEDLLVAWFKMGDVEFAQKDFTNALENYRAVLDSLEIVSRGQRDARRPGALSRVARQREIKRHGGCDEPAGATTGEFPC